MSSAAVVMGASTRSRARTPDAASSGSAAALRLTRRGRALIVAVILLTAVVLGLSLRQVPSRAGDGVRPAVHYEYVVVQPGQTLWQIARAAAPGVDPRVTVMRIQDVNGLPDAAVTAGQRIALPPSM